MRLLVILALIAAGLPMQASADDAYPIGGRTSLWGVKRSRAPFARFHYAGVETVALGWLVARVSGKNLSDDLSEKL